jgi:hypothetical protein
MRAPVLEPQQQGVITLPDPRLGAWRGEDGIHFRPCQMADQAAVRAFGGNRHTCAAKPMRAGSLRMLRAHGLIRKRAHSHCPADQRRRRMSMYCWRPEKNLMKCNTSQSHAPEHGAPIPACRSRRFTSLAMNPLPRIGGRPGPQLRNTARSALAPASSGNGRTLSRLGLPARI